MSEGIKRIIWFEALKRGDVPVRPSQPLQCPGNGQPEERRRAHEALQRAANEVGGRHVGIMVQLRRWSIAGAAFALVSGAATCVARSAADGCRAIDVRRL